MAGLVQTWEEVCKFDGWEFDDLVYGMSCWSCLCKLSSSPSSHHHDVNETLCRHEQAEAVSRHMSTAARSAKPVHNRCINTSTQSR